jgi:hypothetical protein
VSRIYGAPFIPFLGLSRLAHLHVHESSVEFAQTRERALSEIDVFRASGAASTGVDDANKNTSTLLRAHLQ